MQHLMVGPRHKSHSHCHKCRKHKWQDPCTLLCLASSSLLTAGDGTAGKTAPRQDLNQSGRHPSYLNHGLRLTHFACLVDTYTCTVTMMYLYMNSSCQASYRIKVYLTSCLGVLHFSSAVRDSKIIGRTALNAAIVNEDASVFK